MILLWWIGSAVDNRAEYEKNRKEFEEFVRRHESAEWVRTISWYVLGRDGITGEYLLSEAGKGRDDKEVGGLCEAYYCIGEELLAKGRKADAVEYFRRSIETGRDDYVEYISSRVLLEDLTNE